MTYFEKISRLNFILSLLGMVQNDAKKYQIAKQNGQGNHFKNLIKKERIDKTFDELVEIRDELFIELLDDTRKEYNIELTNFMVDK